MVVRVTVTLPEALLSELDEIASDEGVTRSDVVREAARGYVTSRSAASEARERGAAVREGLSWLEDVARRTDSDARDSLDVLREIRGTRDMTGAPIPPERDEGVER